MFAIKVRTSNLEPVSVDDLGLFQSFEFLTDVCVGTVFSYLTAGSVLVS